MSLENGAAFRILVQTIESYDIRVPLLLNGTMGNFGTHRDLVYGNHRGRRLSIGISFRPPKVVAKEVKLSLQYKFRARRRELILADAEIKADGKLFISTAYRSKVL